MASLYTHLLFMHGHLTDVALVQRLAALPEPGTPAKRPPRPALPAVGLTLLRWVRLR